MATGPRMDTTTDSHCSQRCCALSKFHDDLNWMRTRRIECGCEHTLQNRKCYSMCGRYDDSNVLRFEAVCDVSFEAVYTVRVYTMRIVVRPSTCDVCQSVTIACLGCTEDMISCFSTNDEKGPNWCARGYGVHTCTHLSGCGGCYEHPCIRTLNVRSLNV